MEAVLKIDGTFGIQSSSISYKGPGGVEWLSSAFDEYRVRLTAEGIHTFTANVIGPDGNTIYQDTVAIVVQNRDYLDSLLKKKWDDMKAALVRGDVEGAVGYFVSSSQNMYRYNFELMSSILPTIAQDMGNINLVKIEGNVAEYEMIATQGGQALSFHVEFVKDKDGVWRIRFY